MGASDDPQLHESINHVIAKCIAKNIPVGISLGLAPTASLQEWKAKKIQFMSVGNEYSFIQNGINALKHVLL